MSPPTPFPPPSNPMVGIGFKVASVTVLLGMASLIKASEGFPPGQLVFFRSAFAIIPMVVFLALRRELGVGLKTKRPLGHLWRGLLGVGGMSTSFYALTKLPLPEATAIGYGMPLLIVVFGALFLKEHVRLYRWTAVAVGMIGVGIIVAPRLTVFASGEPVGDLALGAMSSLIACVFGASSTIVVRTLVFTERSATIVLYFSITCTIVSLFTIPFGWVWPSPTEAAMLVTAGIAGGIGQILMTESYRHADVSVVAPFEYTSLLLSLGVGYVVFHDVPTVQMLIGATIVVGAGLYIIYREHQLGLERRRQKESAPTTPG